MVSVFLLCFFFFFAGCLGESNTDPPTLPPGVINISKTTAAASLAPSAATVGNTIYVVWAEGVGEMNDQIFLARSNNGGISFKTFPVSNSTNFSRNPKVAFSIDGANNIIHVVWEEFISNQVSGEQEFDIFYRRAVEDPTGNLTFEAPKNLSASPPVCGPPGHSLPCPSQVPTITTFNNHVFIAWMESTDYVPPNFDFAGSTFQLFNSDILMVRSSNHGASFPDPNFVAPEILSLPHTGITNEQSPSQNPSLAAANGHLFIAWGDNLLASTQTRESMILFRSLVISSSPPNYTPDIGIEGRRLSNPIKASSLPSITAEGSNVYLIWEGTDLLDSDSEIFLIRSINGDTSSPGGPTFTSPTVLTSNISNNIGRSNKGRIAVSGPNIFISWEDASTGAPLVLFRNSIDSGTTFGNTQTLISSNNTIGNNTIAASGNTLFAFWEDALFGNFEIFFSRQ